LETNGRSFKRQAKYVLIDQIEHYHPEGIYTLCWRRDGQPAYETVGSDPSEAESKLARKRLELQSEALGMALAPKLPSLSLLMHSPETLPSPAPTASKVAGRSLKECVSTYLKETDEHKKAKTFAAYRNNLNNFRDFYLAAHHREGDDPPHKGG
jgi:hypothetical protein